MRQSAGNTSKAATYGFHMKSENYHRNRPDNQSDDCTGNPDGDGAANQHQGDGSDCEQGSLVRKGMKIGCEHLQALPEFSRNFIDLKSEEILDLCAGDQDGDAIGEADHNGARDELDRSAHASGAQNNQQDASHHSAHEQSIDAVSSDNSGDYYDECPGWTANLCS